MPSVAPASYAVFRPIRGRWLALALALGSAAIFGGLAVLVPLSGARDWGVVDSFLLAGFGGILAGALLRFAGVKAVPSPDQLTVRNLLLSRVFTWSEISRVKFGPGDPWVVLELVDGTEYPVMGIQRADHNRAPVAAARLQALVLAANRIAQ